METQYFVLIDGQQMGPYYLDELRGFSLEPDALLSCEGQGAWLPASHIPALAELWSQDRGRNERGPRRPAAYLQRPYRIASILYPYLFASFMFSFILLVVGLLAADDRNAGRDQQLLFWIGIARLGFSALGGLLLAAYVILFLVLLYRATYLIQDGITWITPGKTVGFLFVPILQAVWIFVAFFGVAWSLNRYADRHQVLARVPRSCSGWRFRSTFC